MNLKHGHTRRKKSSATYRAWQAMLQRCYNPNSTEYKSHGKRGIRVCKRWRNSFEAFLADVGKRPTAGHSLDRFPDNDGNYEPGNTRWATRSEQQRNTRVNVNITIKKVTKCVSAWAEEFGIDPHVVRGRLKSGWNPTRALSTPVLKRGSWSRSSSSK